MKPYYSDSHVTIYHGDCRDVLPTLEPVECCITDPPYGLEFMGKEWDKLYNAAKHDATGEALERLSSEWLWAIGNAASSATPAAKMQEWYREHFAVILDALLPGAPLVAFGGTRTHHRLMCGIEDAGFEIRDCLMWLYGSGFPKSLDVGKAIDKAAGVDFSESPASGVGFMRPDGRGG